MPWSAPSLTASDQDKTMRCLTALLLLIAVQPLHAAEPIILNADLTEAPRRLFKASLKIPVKPGAVTLHYPKWIQGEHQPTGPLIDLSGIRITAQGKPLAWQRDDVELHDFHCTVPAGINTLEVSLEYLVPGDKGGFGAGPAATAKLAILNWYLLTLYPLEKNQHLRDIPVTASLTLPTGWKAGTALPIETMRAGFTQYQTVSLETLLDSPALCGQYFREIPIGPKNGLPHFLTLACDSDEGLKVDDKWLTAYGKLTEEAGALFGARHYKSYRFLLALTEQFGHNAIEHHECSDNRSPERMFLEEKFFKAGEGMVQAHEYVHSWNGKYRRPAGLTTPNYQDPMKTRLLWVYEGLTEYYGFVLAVRSGLWPKDRALDNWAEVAEWAGNQKGRTWRPLEDTAAANHLYTARNEWSRRRRGVDFYDEGALIWLDADTLIREKTQGTKSLDDFCRAFHGGGNGAPEVKSYTFADIVKGLNDVVAHDWKAFLEERVQGLSARAPLEGIARGGWKMVLKTEPNEFRKIVNDEGKSLNLTSSIGLLLTNEGKITDVVPGSPADQSGIGPHMKILATNGRRFEADRLTEAITATADGKAKLELLIENSEYLVNHPIDYAGGSKHPHLVRDETKPDLLGEIFKPRTAK
jgi:predicted metalloprotease with PDZ domain